MYILESLESALFDMEILSKAHNIPPFEVYLMGGSGCILAGYLSRATRDFDIVDMDYKASLGRVLKVLEPYDMIDPNMAILSTGYKMRAKKLSQFEYSHIYVLSREDIIISKLARLNQRDMEDIKSMLPESDINLIWQLAEETVTGHLPTKAKNIFHANLSKAMEETNVPNHMQQLKKLRGRF